MCLEFTIFCQSNPTLTFWQALLKWIQKKYDNRFTRIIVEKSLKDKSSLFDTKNWTGEDDPIYLFKDEVTYEI